MASWRYGTGKQYQSYLSRWECFCKERDINPTTALVDTGIDFLASLYHDGWGYSAINTARSALSTVIHTSDHGSFGTHPLVVRLLKGVFQLKPSLPKYSHVWDVGVVLNYLDSLGTASGLDLKMLTKKLTTLLGLLTGQRCQTLTMLDTKRMQETPEKYIFTIAEKLKTTKPGKHLEPVNLEAYNTNANLCVVSHLKIYLERTATMRGEFSKLLISYIKPHRPVCSSTISKWVKSVLKDAGIDVTTFSGNSARPASTSYGVAAGLTLQEILKAGGWSNAQTFAKHYKKPITRNFGTNIVEHYQSTL